MGHLDPGPGRVSESSGTGVERIGAQRVGYTTGGEWGPGEREGIKVTLTRPHLSNSMLLSGVVYRTVTRTVPEGIVRDGVGT